MTTQAPYKFTLKLYPYGTGPNNCGEIGIDPAACYGYWERRDGSEGGGLWFEQTENGLILVDYDGAFDLPSSVVNAMRQANIDVSWHED